MTKRHAPSLCDRHGHTYHCVCIGQRLTQWSPSSSYLLSWASGLKLGLQACMAKCPYPLSHLTPPRVIFWYRVSLCSYKLSPLSWNWQVSFLSAPNAGIRDEDHFSRWKTFLYSISDIKIMCFSPTNNQYFNGCPTIWSQYCSCQKSLGDNTQTPVNSECVPTTLSSRPSQSLTANKRSQVCSSSFLTWLHDGDPHSTSVCVIIFCYLLDSLWSLVYHKGHYWVCKWGDRCRYVENTTKVPGIRTFESAVRMSHRLACWVIPKPEREKGEGRREKNSNQRLQRACISVPRAFLQCTVRFNLWKLESWDNRLQRKIFHCRHNQLVRQQDPH